MDERENNPRVWLNRLVIGAILFVLAALFVPAVALYVESRRVSVCEKRHVELAQAVLLYANAAGEFPGYVEQVPVAASARAGSSRRRELRSWPIAVSKYVREATYEVFTGGNSENETDDVSTEFLRCPSDSDTTHEHLTYVGNCGMPDIPNRVGDFLEEWKTGGIFKNNSIGRTNTGRPRIVIVSDSSRSEIARTLLLSENLQATSWRNLGEADVGMVWFAEAGPANPRPASRRINVDRHRKLAKADYNYARPSSNHTGGVVAAFCDSSTTFLSDDLDYLVYCQIMTPNRERARRPGTQELIFRRALEEEAIK